MKITKQEVEHVAKLARLELTEPDKESLKEGVCLKSRERHVVRK